MTKNYRTFVRLLRLAAPFKWWMAFAALIGFATIGSSIGLMTTSAWIIASAALHPSLGTLHVAIAGVRFFGITRGFFRYAERYVSHQTTFRLLARIRVWFYDAIEPLAPARLMEYRSGDLLARVVSDVDDLQNLYLRVLAPPLIAIITAVVMGVFFASYDLRLAGVLLAALALVGVGLPLLTGAFSRAPGRSVLATRADLNVALVDGVQGVADVVAYGRQADQIARVRALSEVFEHDQRRMALIGGVHTMLSTTLIGLAVVVVLALSIPMVRDGKLDGVMLAVLALATMSSFEAVMPLPAAFQHLRSNLDAANRLFELIDADPAVTDPANPAPAPASADLAVHDLGFRYAPDEPPALDGISFTLPPGKRLAVVGASGAGKTSLINLLLRFWEYQCGAITLDRRSLREYRADDVRAQMAVVRQDTHLFNGTIRENLQIACPDAPEDALIAAAMQAQVHDFIAALPQGYDTWVGEQGLNLSGGERQRLAIARAILKRAPILVLDEATANLDTVTERALMTAIQAAMQGRSTLMITHRLVGLDDFDEILVLDEGRVVERGRHADLLQIDGHYRRLWDIQNQILAEV
ncbi:thiol reductant ABC exporter subunit CydC [Aggregatilinea lenta]|uniref:thiol reductant ABC exporter subunit CydC n=1 Tax=Aggregatilinea lenta TaxID=913108 RepID=UPI000E5B1629|nr:thiol reductant ABC exporter subunit CydC [Aggregatilinea lenta]